MAKAISHFTEQPLLMRIISCQVNCRVYSNFHPVCFISSFSHAFVPAVVAVFVAERHNKVNRPPLVSALLFSQPIASPLSMLVCTILLSRCASGVRGISQVYFDLLYIHNLNPTIVQTNKMTDWQVQCLMGTNPSLVSPRIPFYVPLLMKTALSSLASLRLGWQIPRSNSPLEIRLRSKIFPDELRSGTWLSILIDQIFSQAKRIQTAHLYFGP